MAENEQPTKKPRIHPPYELLYHPAIPGRGEYVRLALEAGGASYTDVANTDAAHTGYKRVQATCINQDGDAGEGNPPVFAPPALRVPTTEGGGVGGGDDALIIAQTSNILRYLGEQLGLAGEAGSAADPWWVAQVALTALDLSDEVHDTHHPIAAGLYYEDQKPEALRAAANVRETRIPKYFGYFTRTLRWNAEKRGGGGKYMVSGSLTYADTTVWQVVNGMMFAFPKEMEARKKEYPELLEKFYDGIQSEPRLKEYLASDRRMPYSQGVFRYYPELDRQ